MLRWLVITVLKFINHLSTKVASWLGSSYQIIMPYATYAPWLKDKAFLEVYNVVKNRSLVNVYQCWELWSLIEETRKLDGDVLEVGVYRGATSGIMGAKLKRLGDKCTLYCCDTFAGVVKASQHDNSYIGGEHKDTSVNLVKDLLIKRLGIENVVILKGVFPEETANSISTNTFRFCHIDVDTYQSAKDVLAWVWPKLSVGGMIVFNDYGYPKTKGVTRLVEESKQENSAVVIHNLNGNGIIVKIK
jgi:O-methyltransferase